MKEEIIKRTDTFKMDSSIKHLTIIGGTTEDSMRPRRGGSRKKRQLDDPEEKEFIENAKNIVISRNNIDSQKPIQPVQQVQQVQPVQPVQQVQSVQPLHPVKPLYPVQLVKPLQPVQAVQPVQVKPLVNPVQTNVILKPLKTTRVKLQPKLTPQPNIQAEIKNQTRKARKIHLTVANLNHRFTRAKRVKDETEKKPVESIREYLVQRGVIQGKSKAPEKMLRSMYSDFMLLKDQAL